MGHISSCEEYRLNKPDPTVFLKCMECIGCQNSEECVVFEDSVRGLQGAVGSKAGEVVCILTDPSNVERKRQLSGLLVNSYRELIL